MRHDQGMPYADPERQRIAKRESARRQRARQDGTDLGIVEPLLPHRVKLETARDVLEVLARQIEAVEREKAPDALMKGRVVAQLAATALKAIESVDLAARVGVLEAGSSEVRAGRTDLSALSTAELQTMHGLLAKAEAAALDAP